MQLKPWGNKDDKAKYLKINNKFFKLCNNSNYIKRILFKYFVEPDKFITFNIDTNSYYSNYNKSLELLTPEYTIYSKKGATFNTKKNYILDRLEEWAQAYIVPTAIGNLLLFPLYYTTAVPYLLLYRIVC